MSSNLYWRPAPAANNDRSLPYVLKVALEKRYNLSSNPMRFDVKYLDYFTALMDAEVSGAREIVDGLLADGAVELWLEY